MQTCIYTLPEISFVGGETQKFKFYLKDATGEPCDISGSEINFAICNYSNKSGTPILSYSPTLLGNEAGEANVIVVTIPKEDTAILSGKYIYQITIIDGEGNSEIPNQGIMNITKNINQAYVL